MVEKATRGRELTIRVLLLLNPMSGTRGKSGPSWVEGSDWGVCSAERAGARTEGIAAGYSVGRTV